VQFKKIVIGRSTESTSWQCMGMVPREVGRAKNLQETTAEELHG
jgi:hypothetical protein